IVWSDHAPLHLKLRDNDPHRGKPPSRLNDSLLNDGPFVQQLTKQLQTYFETNNTHNIGLFSAWKTHKPLIRGLLVSRASYLKCTSQREQLDLLRKLRDVTNAYLINPNDKQVQLIVDTTNRINEITLSETALIFTKLKLKTYTQGNKAGKTLAGKKLHNPQDINDEMAAYYHSLYNLKDDNTLHQPSDQDIADFLNSTTLPTLTLAHIASKTKNLRHNPISPHREVQMVSQTTSIKDL
ncbi:Hypothetical predicted protein, partial [Pelobates cultripes]